MATMGANNEKKGSINMIDNSNRKRVKELNKVNENEYK